MSERLFIRLGTHADDACQWLVWSEQEQEIIASGELADATQLHTLSERAGARPVDALVPTSAITLTQVNLPEKGQRQALKALPFMLEDVLAQDIEQLHFVPGSRNGSSLSVAVVAHEQMQSWVDWVKAAGLNVKRMIPDSLALPLADGCQWAAMDIGNELLVRTGEGQGHSIPSEWQDSVLPKLLPLQDAEDEMDTVTIANYSPMELEGAELLSQPLELPMLVLAKGALHAPMNLMTEQYRPKREGNKTLLLWRNAAFIAAVCILLSFIHKGVDIYQTHKQIEAIKADTAAVFKRATGRSNTSNVEFHLRNLLKQYKGKSSSSDMFAMLEGVTQAFKKVPSVQPNSLRYDGNRSELRLQISADSYDQVEAFKQAIGKGFKVDSGAQNKEDDKVSTILTLRSR
ncbi:type II secretion system protein GspL [Parashewanella curva]|uniref:Type II secretion system protein L n=1 Tax=Parashewanella curva TaxID=2338552 RepID=A0A3L8PZE7_9GAMM|nr:type II secretion system protein GspL [Parashewanella curva]RLV60777.1 type II secretion system protein GspL [Parashewanella curva]